MMRLCRIPYSLPMQAMPSTGAMPLPAYVRLSPTNAARLFNLVSTEGLENTRIEVTGLDPNGAAFGRGYAGGRDFSGLTSFDPLTTGIMAGYEAQRRSPQS